MQWALVEILGVLFKHQKNIYIYERDQALEKNGNKGGRDSILGNARNLTDHRHKQPVLPDPVFHMTVGLDSLLGSLPISVM